jgi:hypothetical protein
MDSDPTYIGVAELSREKKEASGADNLVTIAASPPPAVA